MIQRSVRCPVAATLDLVRQAGNQTDVLIWLAAFTPSFLASVGRGGVAAPPFVVGAPIRLEWWAVPPAAAFLVVLGVLIGMAYLTIVRALVVGEPIAPRAFVARTIRNALRMLGFVGVVLGLMVMLLIPVGLFTAVLLGVGLNIAPVVGFVLTVAAVWALVLLYFADEAIVLSDGGPLRFIALSATVIRRDFGPSMRLIIVLTLISMGTPIALQLFAKSPWSVPFAFVVHAYLATGTATAAMLFYGDRIARIAAMAKPDMPASSREAS